ncbi:MAG: hypothetical protein J0H12_06845 [Candidatus Paracaedimonas acanthamoebae]|mgnify:CR=1 FL=1|uniref:Uncharacterized protein n=1 Tax=Candidatus Paracaedimonas acanthamoebae TaxID=244581 RepID=A0A8J7TU67_9PROT|nr:hypothetical protein [Candidatus Paracaedimonas acanthamoebae]
MTSKLYLATVLCLFNLSAYASENMREEEPYSTRAAACIRDGSTATLDAADRCIVTMGPALELAVKISEFVSRFQSSSQNR